LYHAQLAWALNLAGQTDAARQEAEHALELDAANPHADQKLLQQHLRDPQSADAGWNLRRPESAEQTMKLLRTGNQPESP
jgi:hypothetical protein